MKTKLYVSSWIVFLLCACQGPQSTSITPTAGADEAIVGGRDVSNFDSLSKYVVLIYDEATRSSCTGTIIGPQLILTAAHCVGDGSKTLTLAFGVDPMNGDYELRYSSRVIHHKLYTRGGVENRYDMALLTFNGNLPRGYKPAALPGLGVPLATGSEFTAYGYGRTSGRETTPEDYQGSGRLRKVDLKVSTMSINKLQFRVDQRNGHGICNGDSGGPGFIKIKDQVFVVGVASAVSWTEPHEMNDVEKTKYLKQKDFCTEGSIYMNVKTFLPWIQEASQQLLN